MHRIARAVVVFVTFAATGCVPFALPPMRGALSGGSPQAFSGSSGSNGRSNSDGAPTIGGRVGFHPLQVLRDEGGRFWDLGVGYGGETVAGDEAGPSRHGPYAEVALFPLRGSAGGSRRYRVGAMTLGEYFVGGVQQPQVGATLAATAEVAGFASGGFSSEGVAGLAHGEWAFGVFAGPSVRAGAEAPEWAGTVGITARVPFAFGFACCLWPDSADDIGDRSRHRKARKYRRPKHERKKTNGAEGRFEREHDPRSRKSGRSMPGGGSRAALDRS